MRIKGHLLNNSNEVPGPGQYKNEKMTLYKHNPSWKIGTSQKRLRFKKELLFKSKKE